MNISKRVGNLTFREGGIETGGLRLPEDNNNNYNCL